MESATSSAPEEAPPLAADTVDLVGDHELAEGPRQHPCAAPRIHPNRDLSIRQGGYVGSESTVHVATLVTKTAIQSAKPCLSWSQR